MPQPASPSPQGERAGVRWLRPRPRSPFHVSRFTFHASRIMKFFGLNITRSPSTPGTRPSTRSLSPEALAWLGRDPEPTGPILSDAYQQVAWVYRAVNVLAEQIANIPFLFSRGE